MKISHVEKSINGYLAHQESEIEDKEPIVCQEIRGGVIVPDVLKGRPGYYLLLGRTREESLVFLKEEAEHSREALIEKIKNDESRFLYHTIYTGEPIRSAPGDLRDSFFMDLRKAFREKIAWVKLYPAFYQNDIMHGLNLFSQWRNEGALAIPRDSLLAKQIGQIEPGVPPDELYAFHALSYILGGFKLQEIPVEEIATARRKTLRKDSLKGLTGADRAAWEERDHIFRRIKEENEYVNNFQ
ncbi:MAG: hypothetical protein SRB2_02213 [Desulfobacteraceae bacterium Eth-SRB2]|nr:MAG: hypothetical protein SRB2_02213 [Desulfobacteraceae bacterium Eth-SRB2]